MHFEAVIQKLEQNTYILIKKIITKFHKNKYVINYFWKII